MFRFINTEIFWKIYIGFTAVCFCAAVFLSNLINLSRKEVLAGVIDDIRYTVILLLIPVALIPVLLLITFYEKRKIKDAKRRFKLKNRIPLTHLV